MTSQTLQIELANLIQESKRKHSELRNAAEQSLSELKALPSTSEAQITADLIRRPNFITPFLLACQTRQVKLATIGAVCLQRLATSHALSPDRLGDTLSALRESTGLSQDVQLKILQTLPALLHNYSDELSGELLAQTLEICATLQASKVAAVSNTAAATLQQLVISTFEKVVAEDGNSDHPIATKTVSVDGSDIDVGVAAYDALLILGDLCHLVEGEKLEFLQIKGLSPVFVLELIESILSNNIKLLRSHPEQMYVLRNRLMPLIVRYLSERHGFPQTLRITRILLIILRNFMNLLPDECEMALALLIHLLEPDVSVSWKRVLCMEVFRGLHAEPGLIRLAYALFDEVKGQKTIVKDHMTSLLRLASEKPSLIGISHQSTVPSSVQHSRSNTEEQITLESGGVAGVIGAAVNAADENVTGISSQWSTVRAPYLELLDKSEPPPPPETYIYSLVLSCISLLSEGLARFILPLTVTESRSKRKKRTAMHDREQGSSGDLRELHRSSSTRSTASDSKKQTVPLNPLTLEDHPQIAAIRSSAGIIESCWPAILSTCSTLLYAALDADFYHNLVRSFQKLTHVAGLLRQSAARDAFLTTLGKATIPVDSLNARGVNQNGSGSGSQQAEASETTAQGTSLNSPVATPKASFEASRASLSTRNLLCLRALLNLGIALGPTLDQAAWSILLETLQNADLVIKLSAVMTTKPGPTAGSNDNTTQPSHDIPRANMGNEIIAVQTVASRMFESTAEYPNDSFEAILKALLNLASSFGKSTNVNALSPTSSSPSRRMGRVHQTTRSISFAVGKSKIQDDEINFVLEKTKDLGSANIDRLSTVGPEEDAIWDTLNVNLIVIVTNIDHSPAGRLKASRTLNSIVLETMSNGDIDDETKNALQLRNLRSLQSQIGSLYQHQQRFQSSAVDIEAHEQVLDTLKVMLEQHGETFVSGWDLVFELVSSVFDKGNSDPENISAEDMKNSLLRPRMVTSRSPRLVRAAYNSLQLIASDFLTLLPPSCLLNLVDSFSYFASQDQDFNISLTTTTFFWNVSDFLQAEVGKFSIENSIDTAISEESLAKLTDDSDIPTSRGALWLLLLLRIVGLTTDSRPEIRNSAIRTLLRIFDAYGPQLSPRAWNLCLNRVLFVMMSDVQTRTLETTKANGEGGDDQAKAWEETAVIMIKGGSDLIANFFDPILKDAGFDSSWERFLGFFQVLAQINTHEVVEAVFGSLHEIIKHAETSSALSNGAVRLAWLLWVNNHPVMGANSLNMEDSNQDALLAYFRSFQQIYRLYKSSVTEEQVRQILLHMRVAMWNSVTSRYSLDIDSQSTLQELIIECMKALCYDKSESQPAIVTCLADFCDAALTQWSADRDRNRPSFVAFSKAAIDLTTWYIAEHGIKVDIFSDGSLVSLLQHLAHPIVRKYNWQGKDREPFIWQKATTSAINILRVAVPYVEKQYGVFEKSDITRFWSSIVEITHGIITASIPGDVDMPLTRIASDEEFDIDAFQRLVPLIIPSLGSSNVPESIQRDFSCALVESSFIYPPQRMDKPINALLEKPLHDLYKVRRGRTYNPVPISRSRIAYVLVDTMFQLAHATTPSSPKPESSRQNGVQDTDPTVPSRIALARSIMPYLILRSSLPLKSYIADQPLRGLMPQPASAHRELIHVLTRLVDLESEPVAIPEDPNGIVSSSAIKTRHNNHLQYRKHLGWMYPLVVKCVHVAGQVTGREDRRVLENLVRILDAVGDCSNIDHEEEDEEDE
ncbi:putative endosomal peripheral membrane protein [Talaromyces proteolyticus]|uniref:Endosomal peripheral membrane protein n=1 Tax=Talaromyces proteolyticus TaxID=1131652 RepID=A0AAD4KRA8_9EURO|nr:putative endosomal peripheral membrane protein [Talaromyces proteolyticus]KAH8697541.1 putative endosomal peripheral membrane protein [Talaromyces proteolyticus]